MGNFCYLFDSGEAFIAYFILQKINVCLRVVVLCSLTPAVLFLFFSFAFKRQTVVNGRLGVKNEKKPLDISLRCLKAEGNL